MYKVGDKVLCKKDFSYNPNGMDYKYYKYYNKGSKYIINSISDTFIGLTFNKGARHHCKQFYLKRDKSIHDKIPTEPYIYDYFYTTIELRKIKLERLQCTNIK